ncbi:MAG: nicotinamide mononucleotide transporter [Paludibacteraceae bacterium]|nr:nicotinamide mononucleotide transporter [Paludibacteraceae bacterium]
MKQILWKQFAMHILFSIGIFSALFLILYSIEWLIPALNGMLLKWHESAFLVGIPASVIGVAYVLTIRNPKNYTGFCGGILMALLLSVQFYLQGNIDLVFLQLLVFVPFMLSSLLRWRKLLLQPQKTDQPFVPEWLPRRLQWLSVLILLIVVLGDYALATLVIQQDAWDENILIKLMGGVMIASSTLANFILIYQKIDAWIWWGLYALSGIVLYVLIGNLFSVVLFVVFLVINGSAGIAWFRLRKQHTS